MKIKHISLVILLIIILNIFMPPIFALADDVTNVTITCYDEHLANCLASVLDVSMTPSADGTTFSLTAESNKVKNRTNLDLMGCEIKDVRGIEVFTNLNYLYLEDNMIEDISPLRSLTNLTELALDNNNISDITPLSSLVSINALSLKNNKVSNLTPLKDYEAIGMLELSGNEISDVTPLASIDKLHMLLLDDNNISNPAPLASLSSTLIALSINNNKITSIDSISDLNLLFLDIGNNNIRNLSSLSKMTNLMALFAKNTGVKDISFMSSLPYISSLDLSDNKLESIELLRTIGNQIENERLGEYLEAKQFFWASDSLTPVDVTVQDHEMLAGTPTYTNPYIGDELGTMMYVTNKGFGDIWGSNRALLYIDLSNNNIPSFDSINGLITGKVDDVSKASMGIGFSRSLEDIIIKPIDEYKIKGIEEEFAKAPELNIVKDPIEDLYIYNYFLARNKVFINNNNLQMIVLRDGIGVLNFEDQYLEEKTNKTEVNLPPVFNEACEFEHIVYSDESHQLQNASLSADGTKLILGQDGNVSEAKIRLGTAEYTTFRVYHDSKAPVLTVNYSTKDLTNKDVLVTVVSDKKIAEPVDGWELSESGMILTKNYSLNGNETIVVKDEYGNQTSQAIAVNNIDKVPPTVEVRYEDNTNGTKTAILKANEKVQMVNGWTLSEDGTELRKVYTESNNERVVVYDLAGNGTEKDVSVTIAKDSSYNVKNNPENITNKNVTVVINTDKDITRVPEGWTLSTDRRSISKEYNDNVNETVSIGFGDESVKEVPVVVNNIDKVMPSGNATYSITTLTNKDVEVTIKASEKINRPNGWDISEDGTTLTKVYKENGEETVKLVDQAGNETSLNISVSNIDKAAPNVSIKYETGSDGTKVIITANEDLIEKNENGWSNTDKVTVVKSFSSTSEEEVQLFDLAGNSTTVKVSPEVNKKSATVVVDKTTATTKIPQTGASMAVKVTLIGLAILMIYTFIRLQKDKELKVSLRDEKRKK